MHSVDVEEVGLPSPLLAEGQFVDCVISARFSLGEKFKSRRRQLQLHQFTVTFPPVKQRPMTAVQDGGTKTASTYPTLTNLSFFLNPYQDHELYQGVAPPGLTNLTYRWRARQERKKTSHKRGKRLCTRVYALITHSHL